MAGLQDDVAHGPGEESDDGRGEGDLHVVGHRGDVARGEPGQRGAHGDECAHESEDGAELGEHAAATQVGVGAHLILGQDTVDVGRVGRGCDAAYGLGEVAFGRGFDGGQEGVEVCAVPRVELLLELARLLGATQVLVEETAEHEYAADKEVKQADDDGDQQPVGDPKEDV